MNCPECGKRIYTDASNCFYCGAVLGLGQDSSEEKPNEQKAQPYEQHNNPTLPRGTNKQQPTPSSPPNKTPPPSIDGYFTRKGSAYSGKPPLPPKPQSPYVNKSGKGANAGNKAYANHGTSERRKKVGIIVVVALLLTAFVVAVTTSVLKDKMERKDGAIAFSEAVDLLKTEMKSEGWLFVVSDFAKEKESSIYAHATNKTGVSYKNLNFFFAVYNKEEELIGTEKIKYEFFEKDTTQDMLINISFLGEDKYSRYISQGDRVKLIGIIGEPYNFEEDASGLELEIEPILSKADSEKSDTMVSYDFSLTNKNLEPTAAMSFIIPIYHWDYEENYTVKEVMRVLVPPLESGESYSETLEDVFKVWYYSKTANIMEEFLSENEYIIGDPVVFMAKDLETPYLMEEPYILANLTPFIADSYSKVTEPYGDKSGPNEFDLSLRNLQKDTFYSVSVKVSFYDERLNKLETVTINIGGLQGHVDDRKISSFSNSYSLHAIFEDGENAYSARYYRIDGIYGYSLE